MNHLHNSEPTIQRMVWSWTAIVLAIALGVVAILLTSYLGAFIILCGVSVLCVGIGEGVRRARHGRALEHMAQAQLLHLTRVETPWPQLQEGHEFDQHD